MSLLPLKCSQMSRCRFAFQGFSNTACVHWKGMQRSKGLSVESETPKGYSVALCLNNTYKLAYVIIFRCYGA